MWAFNDDRNDRHKHEFMLLKSTLDRSTLDKILWNVECTHKYLFNPQSDFLTENGDM